MPLSRRPLWSVPAWLHWTGGLALVLAVGLAMPTGAQVGTPQTGGAEAGRTAADLRAEWERAVGLVQAGEASAAIPLLERLVTLLPDVAPVRLELGLAYFLTGTDDKARHHVRSALAGTLSDNERAGAEEILARIEARRPWSFTFGFAFVPQTNAGRRTSNETVMIGGLPFRLNETADSGIGLALNARFTHLPVLADGLRGRLQLSFGGNVYEERTLNDYTLRAEAGLLRRAGPREWGGGLSAAQRWVGDARYTLELGVYASFGLRPDERRQMSLRLDLAERRAQDRPALQGRIARAVLAGEQVLTPRLAAFARGFVTLTDARSASESGRQFGLTLGASYLFDGGWRTALEVTASRDLRDGPAPLFNVTRRDSELRVAARLLNREVQLRGYAPVLEVGHERRRSTLPLAEFRNSYVSLGLERAF